MTTNQFEFHGECTIDGGTSLITVHVGPKGSFGELGGDPMQRYIEFRLRHGDPFDAIGKAIKDAIAKQERLALEAWTS